MHADPHSNNLETSAPQTAPKPAVEATDCGTEKLDSFVGQQATAKVLSHIQKSIGHNRIRTRNPQSVVTMDYRSDRLNVDTDADGRILRVRCG